MPSQRDISTRHLSNVRPVLTGTQLDPNSGGISPAAYAIFQDLTTIETFLLGQGYTQVKLDGMSKNDKIYAARLKTASVSPAKP